MTKNKPNTGEMLHAPFALSRFFPYHVRVFYTEVSSAIAAVYQENHDITPAEWRCMAILNVTASMTAAEIILASSMDKVNVSRAISKLRQKGWVIESANHQDGRSKLIDLSPAGQAILADLVPKVLEVERQLLEGIDQDQLRVFQQIMQQVSENRARIAHAEQD